ncbi:MAG: hypothetical protein V3U32_00770 [Anaerolineales bacterium]
MDPFDLKRHYPITAKEVKAAWKHQVRIQVYFPLGVGLLLLGLLIGLIWLSQTGDPSVWADMSLILLFAAAIILGLLGLVIIVMGVIGVIYLIRMTPLPLDRTREAAYDAQAAVSEASEVVTRTVIVPRAATYALIAGVRYLAGIFKG